MECKAIESGYTAIYGIERNCNFKTTNLKLCKECQEYGKLSQEEWFRNNFNKLK